MSPPVTRPTAPLAALCAALSLAVALPPAAGASALKGIWGPAIFKHVSDFPIYRDLGMKLYEDRLEWSTIAPTRPRHPTDPRDPAYHWPAEVGAAVREAGRYHMKVALQIITAPAWANGGKGPTWAPLDPRDFAAFAAAAARRYPSVHLWMIWGEPTRAHDFNPIAPAARFAPLSPAEQIAPHLYARMLDAAYAALKHASRRNLVIGGMTYTTGDISTQQWIENLRLPDGRPPRLDMYGHNPFSFREPNFANPPSPEQSVDFSDLPRLARLVDRYLGSAHNRHPPLFISEWTVPTSVDYEFNFYVDPAVQARWIAAALRLANRWPRIYGVGWIHLYDEPNVSSGGLLYAGGAKKPGYLAWKRG
jgi:hypothetical protein